jgi:hypothetical protein
MPRSKVYLFTGTGNAPAKALYERFGGVAAGDPPVVARAPLAALAPVQQTASVPRRTVRGSEARIPDGPGVYL